MNQVKMYFKTFCFKFSKVFDNLMIFEHQVLGSFKSHMDKKVVKNLMILSMFSI